MRSLRSPMIWMRVTFRTWNNVWLALPFVNIPWQTDASQYQHCYHLSYKYLTNWLLPHNNHEPILSFSPLSPSFSNANARPEYDAIRWRSTDNAIIRQHATANDAIRRSPAHGLYRRLFKLSLLFNRKSDPSLLRTCSKGHTVQAWPWHVGIHGLFPSTTIYRPPNRLGSWQTRKTSRQSVDWCTICDADTTIMV